MDHIGKDSVALIILSNQETRSGYPIIPKQTIDSFFCGCTALVKVL